MNAFISLGIMFGAVVVVAILTAAGFAAYVVITAWLGLPWEVCFILAAFAIVWYYVTAIVAKERDS